jgi:hypothetical protein
MKDPMKRILLRALLSVATLALLSGCLNLQLGGGSTTKPQCPTVGQQLLDLQHAKDAGAITEAEYQAQKAKILGHK